MQPVGINPVGVNVSYFNHFVYVLDQEPSPNAKILGFSQNTTTGALTPIPGTTVTGSGASTVTTGYAAGVTPSAIAEELTARFIYVTDQAANQLIGYTVQANGSLVPMINGPFQHRAVPHQPHHRPHRQADLRRQLQRQHGAGLCHRYDHGHALGGDRRLRHAVGRGTHLRRHRSRAGHFPLYLGHAGQHRHRGAAHPQHRRLAAVQNSPFPALASPPASPQCRTAPTPRRSSPVERWSR